MKRILSFLFYIILFVAAKGQRNYGEAIKQGDDAYEKQEYKTAINKYFAAEAFDPTKKDSVKAKVNRAFEKIQSLRQAAIISRDQALHATMVAKQATQVAVDAQKSLAIKQQELTVQADAFKLHIKAHEVLKDDATLALRLEEYAFSMYNLEYFYQSAQDIYSSNTFYRFNIKHVDSINSIAFSTSGDTLIAAGPAGVLLYQMKDYSTPYSTTEFYPGNSKISPDEKAILGGGDQSSLINLKGELIKAFADFSPSTIALSPNGKKIIASVLDTIYLFNLDSNTESKFRIDSSIITNVAFSPDGEKMLASTKKQKVYFFNTQTQSLLSSFSADFPIKSIVFSPDNNAVLINHGNNARLSDFNGEKIMDFSGHINEVNTVVFSPDKKTLATGSADGTARTWNLDGEQLEVFKHSDSVVQVTFSPDGNKLATVAADSTIKMWSLSVLPLARRIEKGTGAHDTIIAVSKNKVQWQNLNTLETKEISFSSNESNVKLEYDNPKQKNEKTKNEKTKNEKVKKVKYEKLPEEDSKTTISDDKPTVKIINFSGNREKLIFCVNDSRYFVWDIHKNTEPKELSAFTVESPAGGSFSGDNKYIALGGWDGVLYLWDTENGNLKKFKEHSALIKGYAFSPDNTKIVTASGDQTAILWNMNGEVLMKFEHPHEVIAPTFSPDGKFIATGCYDLYVRLWDMNGKLMREFYEPGGYIWGGISISNDNSLLLTPFGNLFGTDGEAYKFNRPVKSMSVDKEGKIILVYNNSYWHIPMPMQDFLKSENIQVLTEEQKSNNAIE
jgi:WD40 repeat protein